MHVCGDDVTELDVAVQLAVAESAYADPDDLLAMATDPECEILETLAEFGHLPAEAVLALARHPSEEVRAMLVRNPQLSPEAAALRDAVLVEDGSPWVRSELLALDLPVALRARVLASLTPEEVLHPQARMSEELLSRILATSEPERRESVAYCLVSDSLTLAALATSPDPEDRMAAGSNPVLPLELRRRLIADPVPLVRQFAVDPALGVEALRDLSGDADPHVRGSVAHTCRKLAEASGEQGRRAEQALQSLARDPDEHVRAYAARLPALQWQLHQDESWHVRPRWRGWPPIPPSWRDWLGTMRTRWSTASSTTRPRRRRCCRSCSTACWPSGTARLASTRGRSWTTQRPCGWLIARPTGSRTCSPPPPCR